MTSRRHTPFCLLFLLLSAAAVSGADMRWSARSGDTAEARDFVKTAPASQRWQWQKAGKLEVTFPAVAVPNKNGAFGMWFFNETPSDQRLHVEFFNGSKSLGTAWFNLNFRDWRPLGGRYADLKIAPGTRINRIVFTAPTQPGACRIDELRPAYSTNAWRADDQQPWVGKPELLTRPAAETRYDSHDVSLNRPYLPPLVKASEIPAAELADLKRVSTYFPTHAPHNSPIKCDSAEALEKEIAALGIKSDGTGPALEFTPQSPMAVPGAIDFKKNLLPIFRKAEYMLQRAKGAERDRAAACAITLCRYMLQQGFCEGNANLGWIGNGYGYRHWPPTIFALRADLEKAGLLDRMAKSAAWFSGGSEMLAPVPNGNCDFYCNYTSQLPGSLSLIPDTAERYQRFRALKRFYDLTITSQVPFGDDGSIHHHGGHHPAYGSYAVPTLINSQLLPLEGTVFAISEAARAKVRYQAYAYVFQSMKGGCPINLPMRAGARLNLDGSSLVLSLSKIDSADRQMARLYLTTLDGRRTKNGDRFLAEGLKPLPLDGHITLNLAAIAVHRRANTAAYAAGMLRSYRGLEIYGWMESNNYGRHSRNGSLFVAIDNQDGFRPEGWNWNHIPGATNLIRQPAEIYEGYTMYGNGNDFAGGVTIPGGNGVWGMAFTGSDVHFNQGMFFFDDRITITVSDVVKRNCRPAKVEGGDAVTTLFQQIPGKGGMTAWREGNLLGDNLGNGYVIWKGSPQTKFQTGKQSWTYFYKRYLKDHADNPLIDCRRKAFRHPKYDDNAKYYKTTEGEFALAYIDYGDNPQGSSSSYTILVNADKAKIKAFAADPKMKVLRTDRVVHAVRDNRTRTTGYVVLATGTYPKPLESINRPAFVAVKELDGAYELSVSISDPADRSPLTVKLTGADPVQIDPRYPAGNTVRVPRK